MDGELYYQANDRVYLLRAGDGIFVNADVMHAGWQSGTASGAYIPFDFSPVMVYGYEESEIRQKYVAPLAERFPALPLFAGRAADDEILALMRELCRLQKERPAGYELLIKSALCLLWQRLFAAAQALPQSAASESAECVKKALIYMEKHYAERVTLSDIALCCGLSRSELCRAFHRYTGRTPLSYLCHLRLRRSLPLLVAGEVSIAETASRCGFAGGSYYAEMFRRYFGVSPLAYRKQAQT